MLYEDNDCLVHHGIKGQRWGIRRFQNKDGTLTEEGKKRYNADSDNNEAKKIVYDKENGHKRYAESEKISKEGKQIFDNVFGKNDEIVRKFTQDEGIGFLENDPRIPGLLDHINSKVKEIDTKMSESFHKVIKAEQSMKHKGPGKDRREKAFYDADLESSIFYKEYASQFCDATVEYVKSHFPKEEQDLALAAVFWAYFD